MVGKVKVVGEVQIFCLMKRRPTRSTRTDTLLPDTTLFRSRDPRTGASLGALNASVRVPGTEAGSGQWLRRFLAFLGPGYMVSVGYMDPGNWATDLAGGSQFGYTLLCVILLSNVMAIVLQDRKSTRLNSSH